MTYRYIDRNRHQSASQAGSQLHSWTGQIQGRWLMQRVVLDAQHLTHHIKRQNQIKKMARSPEYLKYPLYRQHVSSAVSTLASQPEGFDSLALHVLRSLCGFPKSDMVSPPLHQTYIIGNFPCQCPWPRHWPRAGVGPWLPCSRCTLLLRDGLNAKNEFHYVVQSMTV